jgi:hypothetical protein
VIGTVVGAAVFWLASPDIAGVLLVAGQPAAPAVAAAAVVGMAVSVLAGWVGVGWSRA